MSEVKTIKSGFWNCCIERPAKLMVMFDDNGNRVYIEACESCANTYVRTVKDAEITELEGNDDCTQCGFAKPTGTVHRCRRTRHTTIKAHEVRKDDILVMQDAIIHKNGQHMSTVIHVRNTKTKVHVTVRLHDGTIRTNHWYRYDEVCLGKTY